MPPKPSTAASTSSKPSEILTNLLDTVKNNNSVLKTSFSSLLVVALEALLSSSGEFFKCPTEGHYSYGYVFIFVPALVAFIIMLYVGSFNKETQGCCYQADPRQNHCPYTCPQWYCKKRVFQALMNSLVAACLWIFWAFSQKKYYTCAVFGNEDQIKNATGNNKTLLEKRYQKAQTDSETIAFAILPFIVGIPMLLLSLKRCFREPEEKDSNVEGATESNAGTPGATEMNPTRF